jgi:hypothetical protein
MAGKTLRATVLAITVAAPAGAQMSDSLASTSFEHYPSAKNVDEPSQSLKLNVFRASVGLPIPLAKRTTLVTGISYEMLDVHPSDMDSFQLHAPQASFGVIQGLSERWAVWAIGGVGFASDFSESVSSDDVVGSVTGIVSYQLDEGLTIGAGATYDRSTGELAPLPALVLNLRLADRARVRGFVPSFVTAEYRTAKWLDTGVRATFEGNRFHLGEEKFGAEDLELAYSTLTVGPKLTFSASDWLHLDVYAAAAVYRRYEVFQDDDSMYRAKLAPVVAYGLRFWVGPSQWQRKREPRNSPEFQ